MFSGPFSATFDFWPSKFLSQQILLSSATWQQCCTYRPRRCARMVGVGGLVAARGGHRLYRWCSALGRANFASSAEERSVTVRKRVSRLAVDSYAQLTGAS